MSVLELRNCEVSRGPFRLGPFDISLSEGKLLLIKGANGSGKSTILRVLQGRLKPRAFTQFIKPAQIGCVGLDPNLMGSWTVQENQRWIEGLAGSPCKSPMLEDLTPIHDRRLDHLSQGWQRRVELNLFLALPLRLILLDEALDPLDSKTRSMFLKQIVDLKRAGTSFVVTSHRDEDFQTIADAMMELS